jgi:transcriptional regulator with XRE-family HTH domain
VAAPGPTKLSRIRVYRRLQQEELARLAGLSRRKLQMLEAGELDDPKLRDLVNLALVLRCELGDIVEDHWLAFSAARERPEELERDRLELPTRQWPEDWGPDRPPYERISRSLQEGRRSLRRRGKRSELDL